MKAYIKAIGTLALIGLFTTQVHANRDSTMASQKVSVESREGFMGGIGIGFSHTSPEYGDSESGFATSVKLGYGINEQFALYYVRNASWFSVENDSVLHGIMGLGATYYVKPQSESLYFNVAIGLSDFVDIDENALVADGTGYMFGIGYEFSPHWQAELNYFTGELEDDGGNTADISSVQFTINYLWY